MKEKLFSAYNKLTILFQGWLASVLFYLSLLKGISFIESNLIDHQFNFNELSIASICATLCVLMWFDIIDQQDNIDKSKVCALSKKKQEG